MIFGDFLPGFDDDGGMLTPDTDGSPPPCPNSDGTTDDSEGLLTDVPIRLPATHLERDTLGMDVNSELDSTSGRPASCNAVFNLVQKSSAAKAHPQSRGAPTLTQQQPLPTDSARALSD